MASHIGISFGKTGEKLNKIAWKQSWRISAALNITIVGNIVNSMAFNPMEVLYGPHLFLIHCIYLYPIFPNLNLSAYFD